jgi:hypothetical protein
MIRVPGATRRILAGLFLLVLLLLIWLFVGDFLHRPDSSARTPLFVYDNGKCVTVPPGINVLDVVYAAKKTHAEYKMSSIANTSTMSMDIVTVTVDGMRTTWYRDKLLCEKFEVE